MHIEAWIISMIVVIAVQNSQVNKKIGDLNFGINNTLQRTNAMLKMLNAVIDVSFSNGTYKLHYHEPKHFISHSQMKLYIYQPEQK